MGILNFIKKKRITLPDKDDASTVLNNKDDINSAPERTSHLPLIYRIRNSDIVYNLETSDGIRAVRKQADQIVDMPQYEWSIEYILQRIATQYKNLGNMPLAIECLIKSNELMTLKKDFWGKKAFLRLPEYLRKEQRFEEAKKIESEIDKLFSEPRRIADRSILYDSYDLVEVVRGYNICGECAKYHDRIYSNDSNNTLVPSVHIFEDYIDQKTCSCLLTVFPFTLGISSMRGLGEKDPIRYSNRPFEDDRTIEEKKLYENTQQQIATDKKDRDDYNWIRENIPDKAPKSFGGYRKMKNANSTNYKILVKSAMEKGYLI